MVLEYLVYQSLETETSNQNGANINYEAILPMTIDYPKKGIFKTKDRGEGKSSQVLRHSVGTSPISLDK